MSIPRETPDWQGIQDTRMATAMPAAGGAIARAECGHTSVLLEAIGFEYDCRLSSEDFEAEVGIHCEIEEYLGWEIQSEPVFVVIHRRTGHVWIAVFDENENVDRVEFLIRKGFEVDLAKAMEVSQ